jgi:hypothetical protein
VDTKNVIDDLACGGLTFGVQAAPREYITSRNLFNNQLLVVTILRTVLSLATSYSNFMEHTCNGEYKLIHVNREDRTLYRNMLLFIFTGHFLERARSKDINPDIEGDAEYVGFHQDDVDRYGYYLLFLRNLPHYAKNIWVLENDEYMYLMPIKEKRKKARELASEPEEEGEDPYVWDVLAWEGLEKYLHDIPIHPWVSRM